MARLTRERRMASQRGRPETAEPSAHSQIHLPGLRVDNPQALSCGGCVKILILYLLPLGVIGMVAFLLVGQLVGAADDIPWEAWPVLSAAVLGVARHRPRSARHKRRTGADENRANRN